MNNFLTYVMLPMAYPHLIILSYRLSFNHMQTMSAYKFTTTCPFWEYLCTYHHFQLERCTFLHQNFKFSKYDQIK